MSFGVAPRRVAKKLFSAQSRILTCQPALARAKYESSLTENSSHDRRSCFLSHSHVVLASRLRQGASNAFAGVHKHIRTQPIADVVKRNEKNPRALVKCASRYERAQRVLWLCTPPDSAYDVSVQTIGIFRPTPCHGSSQDRIRTSWVSITQVDVSHNR